MFGPQGLVQQAVRYFFEQGSGSLSLQLYDLNLETLRDTGKYLFNQKLRIEDLELDSFEKE